ncbi:MAG: hypothetical protein HRT72_00770 [Flavobacteriales bacterium]|nr:hypothetical protein [Flavobacteriales bacterium]
MIKHLLFILISFYSISPVFSQDSSNKTEVTANSPDSSATKTYYLIKQRGGTEHYGFILSDDGREILLETKSIGKIYVNKSDISEIIEVAETSVESTTEDYGDYREDGALTTRYYLSANALPIKKGENYAMLHIYGPEVQFAVSDNLSLGIMATWIASPIGLAAKYSFNSKGKTHFALGTILGSSGYIFNAKGFGGLHWLTMTHGTRKSNFSISAGFAYSSSIIRNYDNNKKIIGQTYSFSRNEQEYYYDIYGNYGYTDTDYYIEDNNAYNALRNEYQSNNIYDRELKTAFVTSFSGIAPVGKKASFIFDSMVFFSRPDEVKYTDKNVSVTYEVSNYENGIIEYEDITTEHIIGEGKITKSSKFNTTILLMPTMRFIRSHDEAFQVTLSGVIRIDQVGNVNSFPVPMISWMKSF